MTRKTAITLRSILGLGKPWRPVCRLALAAGLAAPAAPVWALDPVDPVEPGGLPATVGDLTEDSVLVATRKLAEATNPPTTADTLEPISRHSEQQPELAEPQAGDATPAAPAGETVLNDEAAPEGVSKPPSDAEPRLAARSASASLPAGGDPSDVASVYKGAPRAAAARFHGVVAGVTSRAELVAGWGEPSGALTTDTGEVLSYDLPPFAAVEVLVEQAKVALIKVELDNQQQPEKLAERLRLDKIKPVDILDEPAESTIGLAYPEKGMLLLLSPQPVGGDGAGGDGAGRKAPQFVTHMVIQPLGAEAFALRADQADYSAFEDKFADLEQAIEIEPENAYANWQIAQLHLLTGASDKAEAAAAVALNAEPEADAYRLCWAECLADQGRYDQAVLEARKVLDSDDAPSIVKAGALQLMGRLASMGESGIADKAIGFHTLAIEIADRLATSADRAERTTAKRTLVDAHLSIARQIARRKYARKSEIVGEWIGRASGIAEEMIKSNEASLELRLIVAREALATLADLKPTKDPSPWIKEAEGAASQLLADSRDPMFRSRVEWQLGEAYFHALRIQHSRKQPDSGLGHANQAIRRLSAGAAVGEVRPSAESLVGRLYFHIGAVHAVHKQDHAEAVEWYGKAEPLLMSAAADSDFVVPRRRGEALVSMAVSYWEQGDKQRAVKLTDAGADLMERAVAGGVLEEKALAVPYGNLATMHKRLGNLDESTRFANLARGARGAAAPSFAEAVSKSARPKQAVKPPRASTPSRSASKPGPAPRTSAGTPRPAANPRTASRPEPPTEPTSKRSTTRRRGSMRRPAFRTQLR